MRLALCIAAWIVFASAVWAEGIGDVHFKDINGKPTTLGQARLITFWSSDCAPCLREMSILPDIAKQNSDLSMALISLKDAEHTRALLIPLPGNVQVLVAQDDGRAVLTAFGNDRTLALPYSVMLNKKGGVCGKYYGILSPDKVKEWRKEC
jgi:thiol-disulfide isomerase/thioredoxin